MTNPTPITSAIEDLKIWATMTHETGADGIRRELSFEERIQNVLDAATFALKNAHALGKQEGMDEGAESAVEYCRDEIVEVEGDVIHKMEMEEILKEAARHAHKGEKV